MGPAQEQSWIALDRALASACRTHNSPIRDHMATADVARDLDLFRAAVGDRRLNYVGYSYGTYIGATYVSLFPHNARTIVVDGVLDPVAWATGRGNEARTQPFTTRLRSDQGGDATLRQFFALCDRGGSTSAFSGGNPEQRFRALAVRLFLHPLFANGSVFTYTDLVGTTLGALYDPPSWPALAQLLQTLDEATDPNALAEALHALRAELGGLAPEDYPNFVEGFPGVACSDSVNPTNIAAWPPAAAAADAAHPYFGRLWTWSSSICQPWPGADTGRYLGPFTARTGNPVLVVGNRFDPATRYQGAVTLAGLLPNSRLLTLEGWGHTSLLSSSCIDAYVAKYLLTTHAPPRGRVLSAERDPVRDAADRAGPECGRGHGCANRTGIGDTTAHPPRRRPLKIGDARGDRPYDHARGRHPDEVVGAPGAHGHRGGCGRHRRGAWRGARRMDRRCRRRLPGAVPRARVDGRARRTHVGPHLPAV